MSVDTVTANPDVPTVQAVVRAEHISRQFGQGDAIVDALKDVTVEFERRSFTATMGPSGSGKSTLMHILAGLDQPTTGHVFLDGQDITRMGDKQLTLMRRTRVGFVFQFFNLLPMLTAEENILLPLKIGGQRVDQAFFAQLIDAVGLRPRLDHKPAELSGGQQQRVAIARALITKPAVVFADEPTGNLDSTASAEVLSLLRQAVDQFGQTIVMVTHDPLAASKSDRILFLADGRVVGDRPSGTVDEILDLMKTIA